MSQKSYIIAKKWHEGQMYGEHDYMYHINNVWGRLITMDPRYYIISPKDVECYFDVCCMHDIVEDTEMTLESLKTLGFSDEVVSAIDAITKCAGESIPHYISRVNKNEIARSVKTADSLSNLEHSIAENNVRRIKKYKWQLELLGYTGKYPDPIIAADIDDGGNIFTFTFNELYGLPTELE